MEIPLNNKNSDYESISSVSNDQRIVPVHSDLLLAKQNSKNDYSSEPKQTEEELLTDRYKSVDQGFETARNEDYVAN